MPDWLWQGIVVSAIFWLIQTFFLKIKKIVAVNEALDNQNTKLYPIKTLKLQLYISPIIISLCEFAICSNCKYFNETIKLVAVVVIFYCTLFFLGAAEAVFNEISQMRNKNIADNNYQNK